MLDFSGQLVRYAALWTGESGYVVVGQYAPAQNGDSLDDTNSMDSFFFYNVNDGGCGEIADECPMTKERLLVVGNKKPLFATVDTDGYLRLYDMTKKMVAAKLMLPVEYTEVQDVLFCAGDEAIAVWTKNRQLIIYDISGAVSFEILYQGGFNLEHTEPSFDVTVTSVEDPARNRVYFKTSRNAVICIDTKYWKKVADFAGMDAFCPDTNEIYRLKINTLSFREETEGILRCPAYTLEELKALCK